MLYEARDNSANERVLILADDDSDFVDLTDFARSADLYDLQELQLTNEQEHQLANELDKRNLAEISDMLIVAMIVNEFAQVADFRG